MREGNRFTPTREDPPLRVVEHRATGDPWRTLVACICLNKAKRRAVDAVWPVLMKNWPNAGRMANARFPLLVLTLGLLGLQRQRATKLWEMSGLWFELEPESLPEWRDVHHLPGCGQHAAEAYRVVVEGDLDLPCADRVIEAWRLIEKEDRDG